MDQVARNNKSFRKGSSKVWTEKSDRILSAFLKRESNDTGNLLTKFSPREVKIHAESLGIRLATFNTPWGEKDLELLKICYSTDEHAELARKKLLCLGRTTGAIAKQAEALGLKDSTALYSSNARDKVWTKYEEEIVRQKFPECGTSIPELLASGRSRKAIEIKATKLGLL